VASCQARCKPLHHEGVKNEEGPPVRLFAVVPSVVVTLVLFDQVAMMGLYAEPQTAASAILRSAYPVAVAGR